MIWEMSAECRLATEAGLIRHNRQSHYMEALCMEYNWNNQSYSGTTGLYNWLFQTQNACKRFLKDYYAYSLMIAK